MTRVKTNTEKFQLEWQQCCSVFLLSPDKELSDVGINAKKNVDLARLQQRWAGYCEGKSFNKQDRDAVMISVCSAIYSYLSKRVSTVQQSILEPTSSTSPLYQDTHSVYYRFCGAAIANMLHAQ